jgi:hypothetical protein
MGRNTIRWAAIISHPPAPADQHSRRGPLREDNNMGTEDKIENKADELKGKPNKPSIEPED